MKELKSRNFINISWLFVGKVYSLIIGMLVNVFMVRYFGPEQNGVYNYAISYVAIFNGISLMGIENVITKEFRRGVRKADDIMVSSIFIRCAGCLLSFVSILVSCYVFQVENSRIWMIFISALPCIANIFGGVTGWFYAQSQTKYIAIAQAAAHTICAVLKIIFVLLKKDVQSFLAVTAAETFIVLIFEWLCFAKEKKISFTFQKSTCKYLFVQGLPIIIGSIAHIVFMKVDQLMIGEMLGDYELGIYSVAVRIAELWYFIPTMVVSVLLPTLVDFKEKDTEIFSYYLQKYMSLMVLIGYLSGFLTTLFAKPLILVLFGKEYISAAPILCIYIWAGIFINMSELRGSYFVIMEYTHYSLWCNLIGAITNVIFNFYLIPLIGSMGAVVATLLSYALYAYISSFLIKNMRSMGKIQTKAFLLIGLKKEKSAKS